MRDPRYHADALAVAMKHERGQITEREADAQMTEIEHQFRLRDEVRRKREEDEKKRAA